MRIVFMGTPDFAVPSLRAMAEGGYEIAGVFCQPDRPKGRGKKLQKPPVKVLAEELGIPVYQFERIRRPEGVEALTYLAPDLVVTAAFGQILSKSILEIPPLGCINVHGSLLPAYRGAAPIQWAVMNGEKETGITLMYMDVGVDTGDMILQKHLEIGPDETAGELFDRLAPLGAQTLLEGLKLFEHGRAPAAAQDGTKATLAPMLNKEMGELDFSLSAAVLKNRIRGMNPWPGCYTYFEGQPLKIWRAEALPGKGEPGRVIAASPKEGLIVGAGEGCLKLVEVQGLSGKRMAAEAYLLGHAIRPGEVLGCHG
ncbi:methionyl-tRNA formyltransferase [Gehongia tenuis]|uniref:Methionyl-tRNA formyltransferase n=1 Tax=Gehongia tenuis TaxID=2763655 RepID=A0A926HPJ4_9FIRM|nr:methionyl-tRNA formyltransferase [Gehongia tenuis]MBC8530765.1 methionyl-tRNA formyltransferase [Gehongia tenuis]